jgi:hypothetical protein
MLELLDPDDLQAIAESLTAGPGPHVWHHGIDDIFYCPACFVSFEFGAEPVPDDPCEPIDPTTLDAVYDPEAAPAPADADAAGDDDDVPF